MSDAVSHGDVPPPAAPTARSELRARIGWICHGLRIAAVLWLGWLVVMALIQ